MKPLQVGEVLDAAVGWYRRDWGTLSALSVLLVIPAIVGNAVIPAAADDALGALALLRFFIVQLCYQTINAASVRVVLALADGAPAGIAIGLRVVWTRSVELIILAAFHVALFGVIGTLNSWVVFNLLSAGGAPLRWIAWVTTALTYLGGIVITAPFVVVVPVLIDEPRASVWRAFARSWQLTHGSRTRIMGVLLVWNVLQFSVVYTNLLLSRTAAVRSVLPVQLRYPIRQLCVALVTPILPAAMAVLYRQLRIHREGLDLVLLQQHLGA